MPAVARGATQWTRSGQQRENALLQGYLAQGMPVEQASYLAAQQAGPSDEDVAMGRILMWFFKASIVFAVVVGVLGFWLMHKQHAYDNCVQAHRLDDYATTLAACGKDPSDGYQGGDR
jgi:hypothetical protein